jgi:hypothetical protein
VAAVCIGFSAYITGAFGMNLDNTARFQSSSGSFSMVFGLTILVLVMGISVVLGYFRWTGVLPKKVPLVFQRETKLAALADSPCPLTKQWSLLDTSSGRDDGDISVIMRSYDEAANIIGSHYSCCSARDGGSQRGMSTYGT